MKPISGIIGVLFSGGLDSLCTLLEIRSWPTDPERTVLPIYCNMRTKEAPQEAHAAMILADRLGYSSPGAEGLSALDVGGLADYTTGTNSFIPHRNLLLAAHASAFLEWQYPEEDRTILLCGLRDDRVVDKTKEACAAMSIGLSATSEQKVTVDSLFWEESKKQVIVRMRSIHADFLELAYRTVSCYDGSSCGECSSCFRKWVALEAAGIMCALWFRTHPGRTLLAHEYRIKFLYEKKTGFLLYDKERVLDTLRVLEEIDE